MSMTYYGRNGKAYVLDESDAHRGGEGTVYNILRGAPVEGNSVAKIYHPERLQKEGAQRYEKLEAMIGLGVNPYRNGGNGKRILQIAWPQDILFDGTRRFVGFVMPKADNLSNKITTLCGPLTRNKVFAPHQYSWGKSLAVAFNLAFVVKDLHDSDVIIGDLNPDNFIINKDGTVTVIDVDSVAFEANGRRYECFVGVGDFLAPEVNGGSAPIAGSKFTKETDRFSLAIHIFRLLMNGQHPFGVKMGASKENSGNVTTADNIINGNCAFFGAGLKDKTVNSDEVVRKRALMQMLPQNMIRLFERCFDYNKKNASSSTVTSKRPTAEEWVNAIHSLDPEHLSTCTNNPTHEYPQSCKSCPWCEYENAKPSKPNARQSAPATQMSISTATGGYRTGNNYGTGNTQGAGNTYATGNTYGAGNTYGTTNTQSGGGNSAYSVGTNYTTGTNYGGNTGGSGYTVVTPRGSQQTTPPGNSKQPKGLVIKKHGFLWHVMRFFRKILIFVIILTALGFAAYFLLKHFGYETETKEFLSNALAWIKQAWRSVTGWISGLIGSE